MNNKINQDEINAILWRACGTFRGTVDPAEYKNYILVMLFVKYISDVWRDHYAFPQLAVRVMRSRWGSCSPSGRITLNVKLIQMPTAHIDYVIYHELCHLAEPSHNARYYELLDRVLSDWRERRQRLNEFEFG